MFSFFSHFGNGPINADKSILVKPRGVPSLFRSKAQQEKLMWIIPEIETEPRTAEQQKSKLAKAKIKEEIVGKKDCPFKKRELATIGKLPKIEGSTFLSKHINKRMVKNRQIQNVLQANNQLPVMLRRKGDMALLTIAAVGTTLMTILSSIKLAEKRPD
ncbi:hypothetical protein SNEBB_010662 [Seison nebaliae]|nr:hypothetical protein SNEBB_010662 [Seison nebaliae]